LPIGVALVGARADVATLSVRSRFGYQVVGPTAERSSLGVEAHVLRFAADVGLHGPLVGRALAGRLAVGAEALHLSVEGASTRADIRGTDATLWTVWPYLAGSGSLSIAESLWLDLEVGLGLLLSDVEVRAPSVGTTPGSEVASLGSVLVSAGLGARAQW
jgi:hypothetical protein